MNFLMTLIVAILLVVATGGVVAAIATVASQASPLPRKPGHRRRRPLITRKHRISELRKVDMLAKNTPKRPITHVSTATRIRRP